MNRKPTTRVSVLQWALKGGRVLLLAYVLFAALDAKKDIREGFAGRDQDRVDVAGLKAQSLGAMAVSQWANGEVAVPVAVAPTPHVPGGFTVTALSMGMCWQVVVAGGLTSSAPGLVDCPYPQAGYQDGVRLPPEDTRYRAAVGYLKAWLSHEDDLDRWLVAEAEATPAPFKASEFEEKEVLLVDKDELLVTARVIESQVFTLTWRVVLIEDAGRWSVVHVSGGALPLGGTPSGIGRGAFPTTTSPIGTTTSEVKK